MFSSPLNSPPMNRIPTEIFRKIIQYAYTPEPPQDEESLLYLPMLTPPLAASHVCRSWRNTLLSDPTMWSTLLIPMFNPRGIREFIRRSGSALLDVSITLRDNRHLISFLSSPPDIIFWRAHRFKSLQMNIDIDLFDVSSDVYSLTMELLIRLREPAPELQAFVFNYNDRTIPLPPTFFKKLFSGRAPHLKYIGFNFFFDDVPEISDEISTCPVFHNLSKLSLYLPIQGVNYNRLLDVLELSPRLITLCLHISGSFAWPTEESSSSRPDSPERIVHLPHLQSLVVKTRHLVDHLDMLLRHVKFPPNVQWIMVVSVPNQIYQTTIEFGSEDGDEQDSESNSNPKYEAIDEFLSKAHFTSIDITASVDDCFVDLVLKENGSDGIHAHKAGGNQFTFEYEDPGLKNFLDHWDSLKESIDLSKVAHVQLIISVSSWSMLKNKYDRLEHLFHSKIASAFGPHVSRDVICLEKKSHERRLIAS